MALTKKFFCPVNGWDCPYFKKDGSCSMVDDGDDPVLECDDAGAFWDDDETLLDTYVWEDDNGSRYDAQELLERGYHFVNGEPVKPPKVGVVGGNKKSMGDILKSMMNWEG